MVKQKTVTSVEFEQVPLLQVWKEGDQIKFKATRDIDNYALFGFLKTYIKFLENDLIVSMGNDNGYNTDNKDNLDEK
jgi:hypothetical protein